MFGFIFGAVAGAAGMWAYNKWFGEPDDDDWDTGVWDQPTTSSYPSTSTASETSPSSSSTTSPTSTGTGTTGSSSPAS
jgi:hypothetical protein